MLFEPEDRPMSILELQRCPRLLWTDAVAVLLSGHQGPVLEMLV